MQKDLLADVPYKSFAELLSYQAQNRPNNICLLYPDLSSDPIRYSSATFSQVNAAANCLAARYAKQIDISSTSPESIVVCLLANSSAEYLLTTYGLIKLGVVVFLLSIRNSKAALEHLIKTTGATYLIVGPGQTDVEFDGIKVISLENIDWNRNDDGFSWQNNKMEVNSLDRVQMILHSSGSTSFPKPIKYTNRSLLLMPMIQLNMNTQYLNETDTILAWGALFHILAFGKTIDCLVTGAAYALPLVKNYPPTPKQLLANIQVEQINKLISVPILLEQLVFEIESNKSATYTSLSRMRFVLYGGAAMADEICHKLVGNGVNLIACYGTTETGVVMMKELDAPASRWKWMKIPECRKSFVSIRPDDYVLVHSANDPFIMSGIANQPDGSYSTNDIFIEDPPGSGEYRVEGRQDDILVHLNGEKTNPILMENTMCLFPIVTRALVFGHQRLCTGVLIQLNREQAENYSIDEILDQVWEAVQAANKLAPSHSRVVRQMVKCLPLNKVLPTTDKGNVTRKRANDQFAEIINNLYEKFLKPKQENEINLKNTEEWTENSFRNYLQELISKISSKSREEFNDTSKSIFDIGFDSLHTVQLRNELCSIFPSIPVNFIYEFSTIDSIVNELISKKDTMKTKNKDNDPQHYILTESLVDKYINQMEKDVFQLNIVERRIKERVFLVTGANGSLGSWIILDLLKQKSVAKVFCLFRGQDKQRIIKEFEQRHQSTDMFNDNNNNRVVLLPNMKLSDEFFGQSADMYNQLCNEVTDIVHSAYRMDFNLTVRDFEKDGILGTYHLLKFARKANARFHFISSVASSGSGIIPVVKEEPLARRPQLPIAQGYGQSKYVCEHLGAAAKRLWNTSVDIYRVGQMSGDNEYGAWNTSEMISLIICIGGGELGQMPSQGQDVRWIPVNIASSSIVDIALQDYISNDYVHHILNPHAISWSTFLDYLQAAGLHFQIVNPSQWLETVLTSQTALVKLSSFFETFFTSKTGFQISEYETIKSEARSEHLHLCPLVDVKLIRKYLTFWHQTGFLNHGYQ